jgi:hypothetical protein
VKNIIGASIAILIGIVLLGFGLVSQGSDVTCGGQVMKPGDTCVSVGGGGGSRDYDAQKSKNNQTALIEVGIGVLLIAVGGIRLGLQVRNQRRAASAAPPTPV